MQVEDLLIRSGAYPLNDAWSRSAGRLEGRLRASEETPGPSAGGEIRKAAQEFEALFVGYLLKVMRETVHEAEQADGGLGGGIYTELFDHELARVLARRGVLGIADILTKRIESSPPSPADSGTLPPEPAAPRRRTGDAPAEEPDIPDFQLPVQAPVSSSFGLRTDPILGRPRFHKGLDLAAPAGTEVRAALEGEVVFAGCRRDYGNIVILQHANGLQTRYAHLESTRVRRGDTVGSEDVLGVVGTSGRSTGPHLHFEVIRSGVAMDPLAAATDE